ncbi:MAG TPA: ATP-binding cassette domain-containing protein, partial [Anaerolinea sp.]|nr:ATP-binding cassette domain-containing protein [Anaerolinea sp.]
MAEIVRVRNLNKHFRILERRAGLTGALASLFAPRYRTVKAVEDVSFDLQAGELVGYLGPNGAGKSTTIKVLPGLLVPTSGEVSVAGMLPWAERERYVRGIGA